MLFLWNYLQILPRLTLVICSTMRPKFCVTGGFRYDFTGSQAASCLHFQGQNWRCRVSEEGSKLVNIFLKASRRKLFFFYNKETNNFENHQQIFRNTFRPSKKLFILWPSIKKTLTILVCLLWDIFSLYVGYDSYAAPIGANAAWGADKAAPASGSGHGWDLFYNPLIDLHQLHNKITTNCLLYFTSVTYQICIQPYML